jgi:dTDP-glucose pyrophosphorylase
MTVFASPSDVTVVIPAAGRVAEGLVGLSNITSPAMIPVGGRPVIFWTLKHLHQLGVGRVVVAVPRRGGFIEEFVACTKPNLTVDFITPTSSSGVLRTVLDLLAHVHTKSALVVLGDTHFAFPADVRLQHVPAVLVSGVEDAYRFCVADVNGDGDVVKLTDKPHHLQGLQQVLVGVYYVPDVAGRGGGSRACRAQPAAV